MQVYEKNAVDMTFEYVRVAYYCSTSSYCFVFNTK